MAFFDIMLGFLVGGYFIALGLGVKGTIPAPLQRNKLMIVFGAVIILGNIAITFMEQKITPQRITPQDIVASVKDKLTLPLQMDPQMRLETIAAGSDRVIYNFSITAESRESYDKKLAELRAYMRLNGCKMKDSVLLLQSGYNIQMNYAAPMALGLADAQIIIAPQDCGYTPATAVEGQPK